MEAEIRILIADDHPIFRKGLRDVIESEPGLTVVAEAVDGAAALAGIEDLAPDVAVVDIHMPKMSGFGLAREVRQRRLAAKIIFLTMYQDEDTFNEAMDVGVKGYVLKESAITDITSSVKTVAAGRHYISPSISTYLVNRGARFASLAKNRPSISDLTPTERRILKLIAENKTSREIAGELFVSYRTVENHRANICNKLELRGSHSLVKFAIEHKSLLS
ncbi:MAG: response regulator transcription factor [Acidobacteriota bacterium]|nr:response regulator transcription factor [Acidobacteriota bacterium]